jgi:hypothetical protein
MNEKVVGRVLAKGVEDDKRVCLVRQGLGVVDARSWWLHRKMDGEGDA